MIYIRQDHDSLLCSYSLFYSVTIVVHYKAKPVAKRTYFMRHLVEEDSDGRRDTSKRTIDEGDTNCYTIRDVMDNVTDQDHHHKRVQT